MDEPEDGSTGMMLRLMLQALVAALLIAAYTIKLWRRIAPKLCRKKSRYRLSYRATLDRLSEVGFTRSFGESRETFAKRVEVFSSSFPGLTAAHISNAFGSGKAPSASAVTVLESKVSREVGRNAKWWRRAFGLANPLSWMFSR